MAACLILGDSLAVGVAQARPECQVIATAGITSGRFIQTWLGAHAARLVVISLGANDGEDVDTFGNLRRLRASLQAERVYWLLPGNSVRSRAAIHSVAALFHDRLIDTAPFAGPDKLHPTRDGYAALAARTRGPRETGEEGSPYRDFPPRQDVYRAFPGVTVWRGPYDANGHHVPASGGR